jgi:hypothetical protein
MLMNGSQPSKIVDDLSGQDPPTGRPSKANHPAKPGMGEEGIVAYRGKLF